MPDVGCGVFKNDPSEVGSAFVEVYNTHFRGFFKELVAFGDETFCSTLEDGILRYPKK